MSMSTYVIGIKPPDEKWKKMKAVWESCAKAKIDVPDEVYEYFGGVDPDPKGVIIHDLPEDCIEDYSDDYQEGIDVLLNKLPKDVTVLRFVNSW